MGAHFSLRLWEEQRREREREKGLDLDRWRRNRPPLSTFHGGRKGKGECGPFPPLSLPIAKLNMEPPLGEKRREREVKKE